MVRGLRFALPLFGFSHSVPCWVIFPVCMPILVVFKNKSSLGLDISGAGLCENNDFIYSLFKMFNRKTSFHTIRALNWKQFLIHFCAQNRSRRLHTFGESHSNSRTLICTQLNHFNPAVYVVLLLSLSFFLAGFLYVIAPHWNCVHVSLTQTSFVRIHKIE